MRTNTSCSSVLTSERDDPLSVWHAVRTDSSLGPILIPERDGPFAAYEKFGVEDPRVTQLEGEYIITYSAYSRNGVQIALAKTKDFSRAERVSLITQADDRNVVIFPEKFDGLYARLDRPSFGNRALVNLDFLFSGLHFWGIPAHHEARILSLG